LRDGRAAPPSCPGRSARARAISWRCCTRCWATRPRAARPSSRPSSPGTTTRLAGRKILRLAYHFLEARSAEESILGGYVAQIQALHPQADLPALHRGNAVLADGEAMRQRLSDHAFLAGLNQHGTVAASDVWSSLYGGRGDLSPGVPGP
jgi:hypothetical protein